MMNSHRAHPDGSHAAALRFAAPLLAVLATILVVALLPPGPAPMGVPAADAAVQQPSPYVSSDPSLPPAGALPLLPEPLPHVEAF